MSNPSNLSIDPKIETVSIPPFPFEWIQYSSKTDPGRVRKTNEDAYLVEPWKDSSEALLVVVADGMGGHRGGKEAADIAIATFKELLSQPLPKIEKEQYDLLLAQFYEADTRIRDQACQSFKFMDMGTTIVAAIFTPDYYIYLYAGDCRFYHIRNGEVHRISKDHSVIQILLDLGKITEDDIATHPMRSVVNSSLGGRNATGQFTVSPQWSLEENDDVHPIYPYEAGDMFILCSDGLHGEIRLEKILEISQQQVEAPDAIAQNLLNTALENGGKDNITLVTLCGCQSDQSS
jgi:PPM family protein phosphatase